MAYWWVQERLSAVPRVFHSDDKSHRTASYSQILCRKTFELKCMADNPASPRLRMAHRGLSIGDCGRRLIRPVFQEVPTTLQVVWEHHFLPYQKRYRR